MGDKFFLVMIVVILFVGLASYEKYIQEQGGHSLVAKLIDFAGLADYVEERKKKKEVSEEKYVFDMESELVRLKQLHQDIQEQRNLLVENRKRILSQLSELGDQIEVEAQKYAQIILNEKEAFLKRFPELKRLNEDVWATYEITNLEEREEHYEEIRADILMLFEDLAENIEEDLPRLSAIIQNIDIIMLEEEEKIVGCSEDFSSCLEDQLVYVNKELANSLIQFIDNPVRELERINGSIFYPQ